MTTNVLQYVYRNDAETSLEEKLISSVDDDHLAVLGFPGVGKSASAMAIAARYSEQRMKPVIVLSIDQSSPEPHGKIEVIKLDNRYLAIPLVAVPSNSTKGEDVLVAVVESLDSLSKNLGKLKKDVELATNLGDYTDLISAIKDKLANVVQLVPVESQHILEFAKSVSEAAPYISTILKIAVGVLTLIRKKKLRDLEKSDLLVLVDDLADLHNNWVILSDLFNYKFRYLFVFRVEKPEEYVSMLKDRLYVDQKLKALGINIEITKHVILPPPSLQVFKAIMKAHGLDQTNIHDLWLYSGGIPAVALMMHDTASNPNEILENARIRLQNKSLPLSWTAGKPERRLDYAIYAMETIYEELKKKNYAYLALLCQPAGVAADELALFCGCIYGSVHTCNNKNVRIVYDQLYNENCCPEPQTIQFMGGPCNGNEPCSYKLDKSIVDSYTEKWTRRTVSNKDESIVIDEETAPSIMTENGRRVIYTFNTLFRHIPVLLNEIEKKNTDIHNELQEARKTLLKIMEQELKYMGRQVSTRIIYSAYDHIRTIDDLSQVKRAPFIFIEVITAVLPFLAKNAFIEENIRMKLVDSAIKDEVYMAQFVMSACELAYTFNSSDKGFAGALVDDSWDIFNSVNATNSTNRLFLLMYAYSLTRISYVRADYYAQLLSANLLHRICQTDEDPICLYARYKVFTESYGYYFSFCDLEGCRLLLMQAEKDLWKLTEIYSVNPQRLSFMSDNFALKPDYELAYCRIRLDSLFATLFYYSGRLDEAAAKYDKVTKDYGKLEYATGKLSNLDNALVTNLLNSKNDMDFRMTLHKIADVDTDVIAWLKRGEYDEIRLIDIRTLESLHCHSVLARATLNEVYGKMHDPLNAFYEKSDAGLEEELLDRYENACLTCILLGLEKIIRGNYEISKFMENAIVYLTSVDSLKNISLPVSHLWQMIQNDQEFVNIKIDEQGVESKVSRQDLRSDIVGKLDALDNDYIRSACRPYRTNSDDGLFMESICCMVSLLTKELVEPRIEFVVTFCLINSSYLTCMEFLSNLANNSGFMMPIDRRLCEEMRDSCKKYVETNSDANERKELGKAYIRLCIGL